jgi:hypothetical protein
MDTTARHICEREGIYYCCSVNEKSFSSEVRAVQEEEQNKQTKKFFFYLF